MTVDPELVGAVTRAVAEGQAESVSGWVSAAIMEKADRDRKLARLRAAVAEYEAEFGEISAEEMAAQARADRGQAVVVRGSGSSGGRAPRRRRSASA